MNKTIVVAEPGKQELIITRTFDAPRELVFKACTDPELIPQWWGPRYLTTTIDKLDAKPGGSWRFVQQDAQGNEYAFHGVYHAVRRPEQTVETFEFEGLPGHVILESTTLADLGGQTRLTVHSVYQSVEDRDGMIAEGMEQGLVESHDRLEELLAKTVPSPKSRETTR